jgi:hypothetical protein
MLEILQSKLNTLNYNLNNDIIAEEGLSFMLGQQELLMELLNSYYSKLQHYYDDYDDNDYDNNWSVDEWSMYNDDLAHYKQQEIDNMYNTHYHYSWWTGKNIMSSDNYWFTSDELNAFRIIWQRRISAM